MSRYSKPANLPGFWLSDVICSPGGESSQRWRYGRGSQKVPIEQGGSCGAPVELLQRLRPGLSNATHATLLSSRVRPRTALKSARVATADVNTGRVAEQALNDRHLGASRLLPKGTLRLPDRPRPLIRSFAARTRRPRASALRRLNRWQVHCQSHASQFRVLNDVWT